MTEDEKLIQEVQDQCEYFAKGIINSLCKRAIRKINSWNIHIGTCLLYTSDAADE